LISVIDLDRVSDLELLRQVAKIQDLEIRRLHQKVTELTKKLATARGSDPAEIEEQLRLLQKELEEAYRRSKPGGSERRPREKPDKPAEERAPQKGHAHKPQPNLRIVDAVHRHDEADMTCPSCGGRLEEWANQFQESEEIDVVEIEYVLKKHRRQKYRCRCGGPVPSN
jgi:transposase